MYGNLPTAVPTVEGLARAWELQRVVTRPDHEAGLAAWLVDTITISPADALIYRFFYVAVVHLRPIEGGYPPVQVVPDATHELLFMALNPGHPLPDLDWWEAPSLIMPPDLSRQFTVRNDAQAVEVCRLMVERICGGRPPHRKYCQEWIASVDMTAEHVCYGTHPSWN